MSTTFDNAQDAFFDDYKQWCLENKLPATLDGFGIWLSDADKDEPEWEQEYNDED